MGSHPDRKMASRAAAFEFIWAVDWVAGPQLAHLYTDFLPVEELFNLAAATLRLFRQIWRAQGTNESAHEIPYPDIGWEAFRAALDEERGTGRSCTLDQYLQETGFFIPESAAQSPVLRVLDRHQ